MEKFVIAIVAEGIQPLNLTVLIIVKYIGINRDPLKVFLHPLANQPPSNHLFDLAG